MSDILAQVSVALTHLANTKFREIILRLQAFDCRQPLLRFAGLGLRDSIMTISVNPEDTTHEALKAYKSALFTVEHCMKEFYTIDFDSIGPWQVFQNECHVLAVMIEDHLHELGDVAETRPPKPEEAR